MKQFRRNKNGISINFTSDEKYFHLTVPKRIVIFKSDPLKIVQDLKFPCSFSVVEFYGKSNLIALVGEKEIKNVRFRPTSLIIYDIIQKDIVSELKFQQFIVAVRFAGKRRILISLVDKLFVFKFDSTFQLLQKFDTYNPHGLLETNVIVNNSTMSSVRDAKSTMVCVFPHKEMPGDVVIVTENSVEKGTSVSKFEAKVIRAHLHELTNVKLNRTGTLLATASRKGTIVRIFNTKSGQQLQEVRRGSDSAQIYSINFDERDQHFVVSSDKNTVHIFSMNKKGRKTKNRTGYFREGEWSFAWYKFNKDDVIKAPKSLSKFCKDSNEVILINVIGELYKIKFDVSKGGKSTLVSYNEFINKKK